MEEEAVGGGGGRALKERKSGAEAFLYSVVLARLKVNDDMRSGR